MTSTSTTPSSSVACTPRSTSARATGGGPLRQDPGEDRAQEEPSLAQVSTRAAEPPRRRGVGEEGPTAGGRAAARRGRQVSRDPRCRGRDLPVMRAVWESEHGRPVVKPQGKQHPPFVSLSRAGAMVVVAISDCGPVGVDVERLDAVRFAGFGEIALHEGEAASTIEARATAWVRKESLLKATGHGLSIDPRLIVSRGERRHAYSSGSHRTRPREASGCRTSSSTVMHPASPCSATRLRRSACVRQFRELPLVEPRLEERRDGGVRLSPRPGR